MQQIIQDFITALRNSGLRVSASESVDAIRALDLIGYRDRESLRDALSACLAKSVVEKEAFYAVFDLFFSSEESFPGQDHEAGVLESELAQLSSPLTYMLISGNPAGVGISMREAGREAGISNIRYSTQKGLYIRKILDAMGWRGLQEDLRRLDGLSNEALSERIKEQSDSLYRRVKAYVEQQMILFSNRPAEELSQSLSFMNLAGIEERDYALLDELIRKMVKRLNTVYSRRMNPSKDGRIDLKGVLRKSIPFQGVPFKMKWKAKKIERAEIVAICDVSRSVRTVLRFLLHFLYSLNQSLAKTRTFVFCSNLVEVTNLLDNYPLGEAISRIETGAGLDIKLGLTDYGQALREFKENYFEAIGRKTSVIFLGDARNNYGDPGTDILESIALRSKRLFWLNPESRSQWGTGDSEMKRYLPYCHVARQCRSVKDLERVVNALLKQYE